MMKATCTKDPSHDEFFTLATVQQDWIVDRHGDWIRTTDDCTAIFAGPDPDNAWQCAICGADADVDDTDTDPEEKEE
jgi:hypothetical protein